MGLAIAVDATGNAYVTGETFSTTFPLSVAPAPFQSTLMQSTNAFVTKFNATGALAYSTYLGGTKSGSNVAGSASDVGKVIAVDSAGNAYVAGDTNSTDFPPAGGTPVQATLNGTTNVFVAKINPNAAGPAGLLYSTYLGGSISETVWGIAVNTAGTAIYVAGETQSGNFPISAAPSPLPFQATNKGTTNAFVTKINPSVAGTPGLLYSTYLGGSRTHSGAIYHLGRRR